MLLGAVPCPLGHPAVVLARTVCDGGRGSAHRPRRTDHPWRVHRASSRRVRETPRTCAGSPLRTAALLSPCAAPARRVDPPRTLVRRSDHSNDVRTGHRRWYESSTYSFPLTAQVAQTARFKRGHYELSTVTIYGLVTAPKEVPGGTRPWANPHPHSPSARHMPLVLRRALSRRLAASPVSSSGVGVRRWGR